MVPPTRPITNAPAVYSSVLTSAPTRPSANADLMNSGSKKTLTIWPQSAANAATRIRTTRIAYWIQRER
jgi:hypothetical protein